jgi:hypothetical protein
MALKRGLLKSDQIILISSLHARDEAERIVGIGISERLLKRLVGMPAEGACPGLFPIIEIRGDRCARCGGQDLVGARRRLDGVMEKLMTEHLEQYEMQKHILR